MNPSLRPISAHDLGQRVAMELGQAGFMSVVAPAEANAAERIATRLGHGAVRVDAPGDARALSVRLRRNKADPVIVSGLDGFSDDAWRDLDLLRSQITHDRLTLLVLSPQAAERLSRNAPNLMSLCGSSFFRWEDAPDPVPETTDANADQAAFDRLAGLWVEDTRVTSSLTRMVRHPAYQEIIAMGERAVRPILRDLEREPKMWGPALHAITGALPVPAADAGKIARVANAWIAWAKANGYEW